MTLDEWAARGGKMEDWCDVQMTEDDTNRFIENIKASFRSKVDRYRKLQAVAEAAEAAELARQRCEAAAKAVYNGPWMLGEAPDSITLDFGDARKALALAEIEVADALRAAGYLKAFDNPPPSP